MDTGLSEHDLKRAVAASRRKIEKMPRKELILELSFALVMLDLQMKLNAEQSRMIKILGEDTATLQ